MRPSFKTDHELPSADSPDSPEIAVTPQNGEYTISVRSLWKVFGKNPERALEARNLQKSRTKIQQELNLVVALKDVTFEATTGETFVVMGLSGSGKSTLVRCLIRLIEATSGDILVDGENIIDYDSNQLRDFRRSKIAMVFQNFGLLPHKNVLDNAAYGLEVRGVGKEQRYEVASKMLAKVGLSGWEGSYQRELSGGMQQRVGLARALALDPEILLMDEPFSGLDPLSRRQMRGELASLQEEIQKTIIFIPHDLDEAVTVGDRIAIMRDGESIQLGSPQDIIMNPVDDFVKEFTQGIPKTKVINVASIISEPALIIADWRRIENLVAQMNHAGTEYAICVDTDNKHIGVIPKQKVALLTGRPAGDLTDILHTDVAAVHPETLLEQALTALVDVTIPIPVVDGSNCFLGVAAQRDILMGVAANL